MQIAALVFSQAPVYCTIFIDLLVDLLNFYFLWTCEGKEESTDPGTNSVNGLSIFIVVQFKTAQINVQSVNHY